MIHYTSTICDVLHLDLAPVAEDATITGEPAPGAGIGGRVVQVGGASSRGGSRDCRVAGVHSLVPPGREIGKSRGGTPVDSQHQLGNHAGIVTVAVPTGCVELPPVKNRSLIDIRQSPDLPVAAIAGIGGAGRFPRFHVWIGAGREPVVSVVKVVQRQSQLFQVVLALRASGCFASLLHGWQQ